MVSPRECSIVHLKRVCNLLLLGEVFYRCLRSSKFIVLFKSSIPVDLLSSCSITESGMLMFTTIIFECLFLPSVLLF